MTSGALEQRLALTNLPAGVTESLLVSGLAGPTAMDIAPDGRIFVTEKSGSVRVVTADGQLLPTPFARISVYDSGERGLTGIVLDPNFSQNKYVYVYYITGSAPVHGQVTRFTADGNVAALGSETSILSLPPLNSKHNFHVAGALHFGPDGKLYIAVGDDENGANSQSLKTPLGKILRINPDGSIPGDNPFYRRTKGVNRAIWAMGLRNPFTFAFSPADGRMFINDVGQAKWEEVNDGRAGGNYGWPKVEGSSKQRGFINPVFVYGHGNTNATGRAITGGVFYQPKNPSFPPGLNNSYFFADYVNGWIRRIDMATGQVSLFATQMINKVVDLDVDAAGNLDYLSIDSGAIFRFVYAPNQPPSLTQPPASRLVSVGQPATFSASPSGTEPFSYQWQKNGVDLPGATGSSLTVESPLLSDDGSTYRVRITNAFGSILSPEGILNVSARPLPIVAILTPPVGTRLRLGQVVRYSAVAFDPIDGDMPGSSFTWQVDLHHDDHAHPFLAPTRGAKSGSFVVPPHADPGRYFMRITLTVTNSAGLSQVATRDVLVKL